jgi:hypothetical protein
MRCGGQQWSGVEDWVLHDLRGIPAQRRAMTKVAAE